VSFGLEDFDPEESIVAKIYLASPILQSRSFPPPSRNLKEKKVEDFIKGLTTLIDKDEMLEVSCSILGTSIAKDIKGQMEKREVEFDPRKLQTHTSLSSGASMEYTRQNGGKWNTLEDEGPTSFRTFLNTRICDLGLDLINKKVYDPFSNVICNEEQAIQQVWKIAYLETEHPSESFAEEIKAWYKKPEDSGDFASGIDTRLGRLLLVWSSLQKEEWRKTTQNLKVKVALVSEPGGKLRPVTSGPTWLYTYLSPAGHMVGDFLSMIPGAHVGLKESDHLYRFGQSFSNHHSKKKLEDLFISTSDLTSATDRARHDASFGLMTGLITGLHTVGLISRPTADYLLDCSAILCSPRDVQIKLRCREFRRLSAEVRSKLRRVEKNLYEFTTTVGVLMGEPLTKSVLTASTLAAFNCAKFGNSNVKQMLDPKSMRNAQSHTFATWGSRKIWHFGCAGDDHTGISPSVEALMMIPKALESMGFEISWEKYRISRHYVHYCQDFGLAPQYSPTIFLDCPRMRLFNQFRKEGSHDNFESPDPLMGKVKALERRSKYGKQASGFEAKMQQKLDDHTPLFLRANMTSWYEKKVLLHPGTYAPTLLGGLGVPSSPIEDEKIEDFQRKFLGKRFHQRVTGESTAQLWERGLSTRVDLYTAEQLGIEIENLFTVDQAWTKVADDISSDRDSTKPSHRRIWKMINDEYVDLTRPNNIVGNKEVPYTALLLGQAKKEISKPQRTRQFLSRTDSFRGLKYDGRLPKGPEELQLLLPSALMPRAELKALTGTTFVAPNLTIPAKFFADRTRLEDERSRVALDYPFLPIERPAKDELEGFPGSDVDSTSLHGLPP